MAKENSVWLFLKDYILPVIGVILAMAAVVLIIYLLIFGDKHYAKYVFDRACAREAGIAVYETMPLDKGDYVKKGEMSREAGSLFDNRHIHLYDNYYMEKEKLDKLVKFDFYSKEISRFGPVTQWDFDAIRLLDNKVLAKGVSFTAGGGKVHNTIFMDAAVLWSCGDYYFDKEKEYTESDYLRKKVFLIQEEQDQ